MNKIILVTGSSRGLGLAIAKDLSNNGFSIILNSRSKENLENAFLKLNQKIQHYVFCYDMTKDDSIKALDEFLKQKNIQIDGIVHNLGGKIPNDIHPIQLKILHDSMRLNLEVAIELNNYLIPQMIKRGGGKIVHIGSSAGYTGNAAPAYAISKGALNTYVRNAARYYAKNNIIICAIVPGILDHKGSEWNNKLKNEPEKYALKLSQMPLGRFAKPEEIAPFVTSIFLIDSMQVTGSIINLEGGV